MSRPAIGLSLLVPLLLAPTNATADPCHNECPSLSCRLKEARCRLERGEARKVKDLLRPLLGEHDAVELFLLLARAYLDLDNTVWARRVLYQAAQRHEGNCEIRSWLVWIHLDKAELDQAAALLDEPGCPGPDPTAAGRWHLLRATLARHRKARQQAADQVELARLQPELLPEDHELLGWLERYARPQRIIPLDLRAELGVGYTTNGVMSSPAEATATDTKTDSAVMTLDLLARFEPPWGRRVRPVLEAGVRGLMLFAEDVRDYSYFNFSARPGLAIVDALRLAYHGQLFLLTGKDKYDQDPPRTFYETHRGELEWSAASWLDLWAGVGRSIFRELPRTRTELDGGIAFSGRLWRLRLIGGLSLRNHWAVHPAYDLWGGTVIGSATLPAGPLSLRARLVLSFDIHPDSGSYFEETDKPENRKDLLVKGGIEGWSPEWRGLRAGLSYEVSHRATTAETYEYTDHRVLVRLRWRFDWDPWTPTTAAAPAGHVALPYGVAAAGRGGLQDERIQDLLRQEDAAQRGSSCVN